MGKTDLWASTPMRMEKFRNLINRQRIHPRIWDFSYLVLKNNREVFDGFRECVAGARISDGGKSRILDVGCGFKPWRELFDEEEYAYIGIDYDRTRSSPDSIASDDRLPFASDSFDALVYSEVLEHTERLGDALKEMRRVAKSGALVFVSSPFVFPEHGAPHDYQRLTRYYYRGAFVDDEIVTLRESSSTLSTAIVSFNLFIESSPLTIFHGIKNLVYALTNSTAMIADLFINALIAIFGERYKAGFYSMPLSYALVVRIRK